MSVEPVTITTRHNTQIFDLADHQRMASEQLGVDPGDIHCIATGPDGIEEEQAEKWSESVFSEDGTLLKPAELISPRVLRYIRKTTWAERPRAVVAKPQDAARPEEQHPWPEHKLPRGARWMGPVTIDSVTADRAFISDGEKLVLVSSPEGLAVMKALDAEREGEQSPTGG